jgi:hypothetical protein
MHCKSKKYKRQAKQREQRRCKKLEKGRRKRQGTAHGPRPTRNQHEVAQRLLAGEVAMVGGTGWAFVEPFLAFLGEVGFFEILRVEGAQFVRQMAEVSLLILTYQVKVLLGLAGMNCVGQTLFRDLALLKLIGYTTEQLRDGFCRRGKPGKQKPLHKNVLADAVEKLTADEVSYILNESVKRLAAQGLFAESRGHFALDGSDLETTPRFKGCGAKTVTETEWSRKDKQRIQIEKTVHGFKLLALYDVHVRIVVAAKVVTINEHEGNFTRDLVRQGIANLGSGAIQVVLIDRGFLDGLTLWQIKHTEGVDFVIPAKDGMRVKIDARAFLDQKPAERPGQGPRQEGHVKLIGVTGLTSYDLYDLRSLIENTLFRELKQGWFVGCFPKKTADAVRGHVFLTLTIFNLTNAYRTRAGQELARRGIRRQRREWHNGHQVMVFAGEFYAIFDIEEVFILMGRPPEICWRVNLAQVYRKYAADGLRRPA